MNISPCPFHKNIVNTELLMSKSLSMKHTYSDTFIIILVAENSISTTFLIFRVCLIGANSETADLKDSEFVFD